MTVKSKCTVILETCFYVSSFIYDKLKLKFSWSDQYPESEEEGTYYLTTSR